MNLDDIYKFTTYILNKENNGTPYTIVQFNNVLKVVSQEIYSDLIKQYEIDRTNSDRIAPFKVEMGNNTSPLPIDKYGKAVKPTDYFRTSSMNYKTVDNGVVKYHPVSEMTDAQFSVRRNATLLKPTYEYPIVTIRSTYFEFMPMDLQYVDITYLKTLSTPNYSYYIDSFGDSIYLPPNTTHALLSGEEGENGEIYTTPIPTVVASTGVELEFTDDTIPQIILKLLEKAGLRLEKSDLVRYELAKEQTDKVT